MSIKLNLSLKQKLTMSQRMQQSLAVLSLSQEELGLAIQKELLENPLLETAEIENIPSPSIKNSEKLSFQTQNDVWETRARKNNYNSSIFLEDFLTEPTSLKSHVLKQVEMSFFPLNIKRLMLVLISYLDERAYLDLDIEDLSEKENIPLELVKEALQALQSLEPIGMGGRDLKECLLIQLRHKKENTQKEELIVKYHLHNLKEKKYKAIAYDLNISMKETDRLCRMVRSLEPNPARNFSFQPTVFVRPDLYIYKQGSEYHVILNKEGIPNLKFSQEYVRSIRKAGNLKTQERKYLNDKTDSARWFIHAIQQRQEKIKKIAYCLIKYQRGFLEKGKGHFQPLTMQEVADEISVHVSTISRIVSNKYAYTTQGLIALKSFFQKGFTNEKGECVSVPRIKESIKKWIEEEKPSDPISDTHLRDKLYEHFRIFLLRRSISQYRLAMGIPSMKIRKLSFTNSQSLQL